MRKFQSRLIIFLYRQLFWVGFAALTISCQAEQTPAPQLTSGAPAAATGTTGTTQQSQDSGAAVTDGNALYKKYCEKCHGAIASTDVPGVDAAAIANAITIVGVMKALQTLKVSEVSAIAGVLSKLTKPTAPPAANDNAADDDDDDADDDGADDDDD